MKHKQVIEIVEKEKQIRKEIMENFREKIKTDEQK
jgi:hypothetical protein